MCQNYIGASPFYCKTSDFPIQELKFSFILFLFKKGRGVNSQIHNQDKILAAKVKL